MLVCIQNLAVLKLIYVLLLRLHSGRDVALSSNQSPVVKFYNTTYEDYQERSEKWKGDLRYVRAMQLWNDWNLQVREWAMTNPDKVDYLAIRSEDLLQHPTWAWQALAKFVGSQLSPKQICCKARKDLKDLGLSATQNEQQNNFFDQQLNGAVVRASPHGAVVRASPSSQNEELRLLDEKYQEMEQFVSKLQQRKKELVALDLSLKQREESLQKLEQSLKELESHHRGRRRLTESVEKRYGKWTSILANQKLLKKYLHQEGAKALHVFRYNPFREFMDPSQYNDTLCEDADHQQYQCS